MQLDEDDFMVRWILAGRVAHAREQRFAESTLALVEVVIATRSSTVDEQNTSESYNPP